MQDSFLATEREAVLYSHYDSLWLITIYFFHIPCFCHYDNIAFVIMTTLSGFCRCCSYNALSDVCMHLHNTHRNTLSGGYDQESQNGSRCSKSNSASFYTYHIKKCHIGWHFNHTVMVAILTFFTILWTPLYTEQTSQLLVFCQESKCELSLCILPMICACDSI